MHTQEQLLIFGKVNDFGNEKLLANLLLVVVRSRRRGDNRVKIC